MDTELEGYLKKKKKERSAKAPQTENGGISYGCDLKNQFAYFYQEEDRKVT